MDGKMRQSWRFDRRWITLKRNLRSALCKAFRVKKWHVDPLNSKPYAVYAVKTIDSFFGEIDRNSICVEIGCGLGDVIGNLKSFGKRFGYDNTRETVFAARILHPFVLFNVGTFCDVNVGKIDVLVLLNFMHTIKHNDLKKELELLLNKNDVKNICFDTFLKSDKDYLYLHRGEDFLGKEYYCVKRSRGFSTGENRRYVEFWRKKQ